MATKRKDAQVKDGLSESLRKMRERFAQAKWTEILIPRTPGAEDDGLDYAEAEHNGVVYLIQRGVPVEIPAPIFVMIKQSGRFELA